MEICIRNIVLDYGLRLKNIGISQFLRLLKWVRKTSISVKPKVRRSWKNEKNETHQNLAFDDRPDYNPQKRKERDGDKETYPPLSCSDGEFHAILDAMFTDEVIKPPRPYKLHFRVDRKDQRYYCYHQYVRYLLSTCQILRRILHAKIHEWPLELPYKK